MFSATWPQEVRKLAIEFQKLPVFLNVGSLELSANHNIKQIVEVIEEYTKASRLYQLLESITKEASARVFRVHQSLPTFQAEPKTLIFVETKRKADKLTYQTRKEGWPALCIHGDKTQSERDWVMKGRFIGCEFIW